MKEHLEQLNTTQNHIKNFVLENQTLVENALCFALPFDIEEWSAERVAEFMLKYYSTIKRSAILKPSDLSELANLLVSYHSEKFNISQKGQSL